jgi:hypothetical protein
VNSSYANATSGVSQEPVERWRERLSSRDVAVVQSVCGPLMDELGYRRDDVRASKVSVGLAWAAAPFAAARAAALNRARLGRALQYARTRAGSALARGPLEADS